MIEIDVRGQRGDFTLEAAFSSEPGGITALFGPSGAGKTTLVDLIAGLDTPQSGRIVVDGVVLFDSKSSINLRPERRRIGYVFQEGRLFPHKSVRRNLTYGMPRRRSAIGFDAVVSLLDLSPLLGRRPHQLSGGEKQRVAIGRALLANPRLLLMDEPLASLDIERRSEILPFIERLRDEMRIPIVYVSHRMEEVIRLADTLVLMAQGTVSAFGPLEALMTRLDLGALAGGSEAGAVIAVEVVEHDAASGLSALAFTGGRLMVPWLDLPLRTRLRVHIRARDVSLALSRPTDISILNIFPGTITEVRERAGTSVEILVDVGVPLRARVTRLAVARLSLKASMHAYALVKAVAIDHQSLGGRPQTPEDGDPANLEQAGNEAIGTNPPTPPIDAD